MTRGSAMTRTRTRTRTATALAWGAAGLLALAGCTAAEPTAPQTTTPVSTPVSTPTATAAPAPSGTASATATAAPSASATPDSAALTACDQLLTPEEQTSITDDGLALAPEAVAYDFDYPIVQEIARSGLLCRWSGAGDVFVVVGQLAVADDQWADRRAGLVAEGFVADDSAHPGFLDGPDGEDDSYPGRGVVHSDGVLYYVTYPGILGSIVPLQS